MLRTYRGTRLVDQQSCHGGSHEHGKGSKRANPGDVEFGSVTELMNEVVFLEHAKGVDEADGAEDGKRRAEDGQPCASAARMLGKDLSWREVTNLDSWWLCFEGFFWTSSMAGVFDVLFSISVLVDMDTGDGAAILIECQYASLRGKCFQMLPMHFHSGATKIYILNTRQVRKVHGIPRPTSSEVLQVRRRHKQRNRYPLDIRRMATPISWIGIEFSELITSNHMTFRGPADFPRKVRAYPDFSTSDFPVPFLNHSFSISTNSIRDAS